MSNYQLKNADFDDIPIDNVKRLVPIFNKEKYVFHYENLQLETRIKIKSTSHIRIQSKTVVKTIC